MLFRVLLLKPPNTTISLLFSKHSTGSKYLNASNTKHLQNTSMLPALLPPSAVHDPTTSFSGVARFFGTLVQSFGGGPPGNTLRFKKVLCKKRHCIQHKSGMLIKL